MGASIKTEDWNGYLSRPHGTGPWPGLIVVHEWWGLDDQTRAIADRLAGIGYLALAPDLYRGERAGLGDHASARSLVEQYGPAAPSELQVIFDHLRTHADCSGKVGAVGFCFGGRMALSLALARPLDAICTFYGGGMQQLFDRLVQIRCPVLGLFGDQDASIPIGTIEEFDKVLDAAGVPHEVVVYPNSGHAFFRDSDPEVYRPAAALDAWIRLQRFFGPLLGAEILP